jgi:SagB-type dehydrogenase family enzyme
VYWSAAGLTLFDCRSGRRFAITPDVLHILGALDDWTTSRELDGRLAARGLRLGRRAQLEGLIRAGLVERPAGASRWPWTRWMPEAAFYHFGTRARHFLPDPREQDAELRARASERPPPEPTKTLAGPRVVLPPPASLGSFSECLLRRRTWRNFSDVPVSMDHMATLLQLTWGVQRRGLVEGQGPVVLKTSPSGGARHPIEAYLVASRVQGLRPGAYHYDANTHELVDLRRTVSPALIERLVAQQDYYRGAAALIVMTAVVGRSMWRYPRGRAYRSILLDAGHLGQTFCLTATALQLAPFSTMAFREVEIERFLRIDGVSECAMFVVGVGSRHAESADRPGRIAGRR